MAVINGDWNFGHPELAFLPYLKSCLWHRFPALPRTSYNVSFTFCWVLSWFVHPFEILFGSFVFLHFARIFNCTAYRSGLKQLVKRLSRCRVSSILFMIRGYFEKGLDLIEGQYFRFDPLQFIIIKFLTFGIALYSQKLKYQAQN